MEINGWRYYNHAAIPTCAPHEKPNMEPIENGDIWKMEGKPLLARWTTDFDCGHETNWWYVIKDVPFDISELKAKRRYEIQKGNRNFEVRQIIPAEYALELYAVAIAAYETYPASYRPNITQKKFVEDVTRWKHYRIYGAFDRETGKLCGYALLERKGRYVDFMVQKTIPAYEKKGINAELINQILLDHTEFLQSGGYICDGSRNINHATGFQEYLEKYFGFRKAYCKLHIKYQRWLGCGVKILYPFRQLLYRMDHSSKSHKLIGLLKMEEFSRGES